MWSGGFQLHGTLGTHDLKSNSNSQQISLSFVMTDETSEDDDKTELSYSALFELSVINDGTLRCGTSLTKQCYQHER